MTDHPLIGKMVRWMHGPNVLVGLAKSYDDEDDELFITPDGLTHGHYWVPASECVEQLKGEAMNRFNETKIFVTRKDFEVTDIDTSTPEGSVELDFAMDRAARTGGTVTKLAEGRFQVRIPTGEETIALNGGEE